MRKVPLLLATVALSSACQGKSAPPPLAPVPVVDTVFVVDSVEVEVAAAPDAELEAQFSVMRMRLLERDARVAQMQAALDMERTEVVRTMAKLQSQASRAQAASEMAEAELALRALAEAGLEEGEQEHAAGTELLVRSGVAFGEGNYEGAVYLASRARTMANTAVARLRSVVERAPRDGETLFSVALALRVERRSNLRQGPGTDFGVVSVLDEGTAVSGLSFSGDWIFVAVPGGEEGWIFHSLVGVRAP